MTATMAVTTAETTVDEVMGKILSELGGSLGVLLNALGTRAGLWTAMAGAGPLTSTDVAYRTGLSAPLVREWLRAQAAGGYLSYHPARETFTLPEAVAAAMLHAPGGAMINACTSMLCSMGAGFADFTEAFQGSGAYGWNRRTEEYLHGSDLLTRTALPAELIGAILDQLGTGLAHGGTVADLGCGYATPTLAVAAHFPAARVLGIDYHHVSVTHARDAADRAEDNLNPSGRMFYAVSTLVCTPNALSQQGPGGPEPLGTLAGEPRLRDVAAAAGFTRARRIPVDAPLNLVLELRP